MADFSNPYLIIILAFMIGAYFLDLLVEWLNASHISPTIPKIFRGIYDEDKYRKSQEYLKEKTFFSLIKSSLNLVIILPFLLLGGFNLVDGLVRSYGHGPLLTGLLYFFVMGTAMFILGLPFSIYHTFVIEKKYGFNQTTVKTFILDIVKGSILSILIGGPIMLGILWFFETLGSTAWLWCWLFLTVVQLIMLFVAPILIMPIFNKFEPLEDGALKTAIETYAQKENFKMKGLFKMDGSKRSSKTNAFFTGIGKWRRIVLFDTLIENHTVDELVAIVAHEMGHYKKGHIYKTILVSLLSSLVMFYVLSLFLNNPGLFNAFQMENLSIYASLIFFGFLYAPISEAIAIVGNVISRKHEYEADEYAAKTTHKPDALISGLKSLSVENLSNLTPHPLKVFLEYSHPPVLDRIRQLDSIEASSETKKTSAS